MFKQKKSQNKTHNNRFKNRKQNRRKKTPRGHVAKTKTLNAGLLILCELNKN